MRMIYHVKICRWTPDDWAVVKTFECRYMWVAKFVRRLYLFYGYPYVVIE